MSRIPSPSFVLKSGSTSTLKGGDLNTASAGAPSPRRLQARAGKVLTPSVKALASTLKTSVLRPPSFFSPVLVKETVSNCELDAEAVSGLRR